jgi:hypothetical protein
MAVTVDYVILPHLKKEDGTNFIRLRVTHKRKSKYIKTNIVVEPADLTRSGNLKNQGKEDLADAEVRKWRKVVDAMPTFAQEEMDVGEVVGYIKAKIVEQEAFRLNFAEYGLELAKIKKDSTSWSYKAAIACLCRYFGHQPDISEITVRAMRGFEDFIKKEPRIIHNPNKREFIQAKTVKTGNAVAKYIGIIRAIYKSARMQFNDPDLGVMRIPVDIFEYYNAPAIVYSSEPRNIPAEWVQMMIDQRRGLKGRERLAVDIFLMSFCLMGMNLVDMFFCSRAKDGVIHYYRTKTKDKKVDRAEMYVRIEPCVMDIMRDYKGGGRLFDFSDRYTKVSGITTAVNVGLRQWIARNKLEDFTFYSARHTWATLGASKQVGVDVAMITEGLSHSDASRKMDMVYIRKDWERVWDANAKVLDLFKWM